MDILRSLIALQINATTETESKSVLLKNRSVDQLHLHSIQPLPRAQIQKTKTKAFAYSSINLNNNNIQSIHNKLNTTIENKNEVYIKVSSAKSSTVDLTLPLPFEYQLPSENAITLTLPLPSDTLDTLASSDADGFTSSFTSITSTHTNTPNIPIQSCASQTTSFENKCDNPEIEYKKQIGVDIELDVFPITNFKFMYQIGNGAFGIVNKAFHLKSCQIVAIKQCRSYENMAIKQFKKEIAICNQFQQCQYIINMIEYGLNKTDNNVCIALEYMNMGSLDKNKSILHSNKDDVNIIDIVKCISFSILNALHTLHSELYVHNDIKPANILINDCGNIKLSDFGCLLQMQDENIPLTKQCGTDYYQSYEKRFVSPVQYTTKSDIYSFGVTICELLVNNPENKKNNDATPFVIADSILNTYNKSNPELIDFLCKCLEKDPKERASASQLLKHSFLDGIDENSDNVRLHQYADLDDLEFMISSLIEYYCSFEYEINCDTINENKVMTPIDKKYSDMERLKNIAKCSGSSVEYVENYIFQHVKKVKQQYLKM